MIFNILKEKISFSYVYVLKLKEIKCEALSLNRSNTYSNFCNLKQLYFIYLLFNHTADGMFIR